MNCILRFLLSLSVIAALGTAPSVFAYEQDSAQGSRQAGLPFRVQDIRVDGLQRLPVERVFAALPVQAGDVLTLDQVGAAVKRLYATGDYEDVQLGRDGDVLVVIISERPAIARIDIKGNKSIDEKSLRKGLKDAGLDEGEVFQRSTLEAVTGELTRQYISQGRYGADIKTEAIALPRNRVELKITIQEGKVAKIKDINIVGNDVFPGDELLNALELKATHFWSFIKGDNKYSRERMSGDLERLRSWYLDRGYINFTVESTQVVVTPEKREVYVAINITEGKQYKVNNVKLAGDLVVDESQLKPLLVMQKGQIFSQQVMTFTSDLLTRRLGNEGYTFAEVNGFPEVNEDEDTVDVTFFVNPGKKTYVRRVLFEGNVKTTDEVMRREMRQFEGAPANTALIDLSRSRMQRLGFFGSVEADNIRVPGVDDLIDVKYTVEEQPSGSIGANVGYSQANGLIFGANVSQNNFMGSGNKVSFAVNHSDIRDSYSFSYLNPYYTLDGVSRGFDLFFSETDFSETTVSSYAADSLGVSVNYGYPISEYARLNFGLGFDRTDITVGDFVAIDILAFLRSEGTRFDEVKAFASWQMSTLNRGILPDRGWSQSLAFEAAIPGSDYLFYKATWSGQRYFPVTNTWTLRARGDLGFGDGYGTDLALPFFENFYSGGIGSVRGYEPRSLGPRSEALAYVASNPRVIDPSPDTIGGNLLVEAGLELIFPTPLGKNNRNVRTFFFADAGNVFQTEAKNTLLQQLSGSAYSQYNTGLFKFDASELRYSVGVGLTWLTAIGPLSFNFAKPVGEKSGDDTENFQFSLGQVF